MGKRGGRKKRPVHPTKRDSTTNHVGGRTAAFQQVSLLHDIEKKKSGRGLLPLHTRLQNMDMEDEELHFPHPDLFFPGEMKFRSTFGRWNPLTKKLPPLSQLLKRDLHPTMSQQNLLNMGKMPLRKSRQLTREEVMFSQHMKDESNGASPKMSIYEEMLQEIDHHKSQQSISNFEDEYKDLVSDTLDIPVSRRTSYLGNRRGSGYSLYGGSGHSSRRSSSISYASTGRRDSTGSCSTSFFSTRRDSVGSSSSYGSSFLEDYNYRRESLASYRNSLMSASGDPLGMYQHNKRQSSISSLASALSEASASVLSYATSASHAASSRTNSPEPTARYGRGQSIRELFNSEAAQRRWAQREAAHGGGKHIFDIHGVGRVHDSEEYDDEVSNFDGEEYRDRGRHQDVDEESESDDPDDHGSWSSGSEHEPNVRKLRRNSALDTLLEEQYRRRRDLGHPTPLSPDFSAASSMPSQHSHYLENFSLYNTSAQLEDDDSDSSDNSNSTDSEDRREHIGKLRRDAAFDAKLAKHYRQRNMLDSGSGVRSSGIPVADLLASNMSDSEETDTSDSSDSRGTIGKLSRNTRLDAMLEQHYRRRRNEGYSREYRPSGVPVSKLRRDSELDAMLDEQYKRRFAGAPDEYRPTGVPVALLASSGNIHGFEDFSLDETSAQYDDESYDSEDSGSSDSRSNFDRSLNEQYNRRSQYRDQSPARSDPSSVFESRSNRAFDDFNESSSRYDDGQYLDNTEYTSQRQSRDLSPARSAAASTIESGSTREFNDFSVDESSNQYEDQSHMDSTRNSDRTDVCLDHSARGEKDFDHEPNIRRGDASASKNYSDVANATVPLATMALNYVDNERRPSTDISRHKDSPTEKGPIAEPKSTAPLATLALNHIDQEQISSQDMTDVSSPQIINCKSSDDTAQLKSVNFVKPLEANAYDRLPKGAAQLPSWWMEAVPHEKNEQVVRWKRRKSRVVHPELPMVVETPAHHEESEHETTTETEKVDSNHSKEKPNDGLRSFTDQVKVNDEDASGNINSQPAAVSALQKTKDNLEVAGTESLDCEDAVGSLEDIETVNCKEGNVSDASLPHIDPREFEAKVSKPDPPHDEHHDYDTSKPNYPQCSDSTLEREFLSSDDSKSMLGIHDGEPNQQDTNDSRQSNSSKCSEFTPERESLSSSKSKVMVERDDGGCGNLLPKSNEQVSNLFAVPQEKSKFQFFTEPIVEDVLPEPQPIQDIPGDPESDLVEISQPPSLEPMISGFDDLPSRWAIETGDDDVQSANGGTLRIRDLETGKWIIKSSEWKGPSVSKKSDHRRRGSLSQRIKFGLQEEANVTASQVASRAKSSVLQDGSWPPRSKSAGKKTRKSRRARLKACNDTDQKPSWMLGWLTWKKRTTEISKGNLWSIPDDVDSISCCSDGASLDGSSKRFTFKRMWKQKDAIDEKEQHQRRKSWSASSVSLPDAPSDSDGSDGPYQKWRKRRSSRVKGISKAEEMEALEELWKHEGMPLDLVDDESEESPGVTPRQSFTFPSTLQDDKEVRIPSGEDVSRDVFEELDDIAQSFQEAKVASLQVSVLEEESQSNVIEDLDEELSQNGFKGKNAKITSDDTVRNEDKPSRESVEECDPECKFPVVRDIEKSATDSSDLYQLPLEEVHASPVRGEAEEEDTHKETIVPSQLNQSSLSEQHPSSPYDCQIQSDHLWEASLGENDIMVVGLNDHSTSLKPLRRSNNSRSGSVSSLHSMESVDTLDDWEPPETLGSRVKVIKKPEQQKVNKWRQMISRPDEEKKEFFRDKDRFDPDDEEIRGIAARLAACDSVEDFDIDPDMLTVNDDSDFEDNENGPSHTEDPVEPLFALNLIHSSQSLSDFSSELGGSQDHDSAIYNDDVLVDESSVVEYYDAEEEEEDGEDCHNKGVCIEESDNEEHEGEGDYHDNDGSGSTEESDNNLVPQIPVAFHSSNEVPDREIDQLIVLQTSEPKGTSIHDGFVEFPCRVATESPVNDSDEPLLEGFGERPKQRGVRFRKAVRRMKFFRRRSLESEIANANAAMNASIDISDDHFA